MWVHFTRTCQTTLHVPVRPLYTYLSDKTDKFKFIEWWSRKYHRKTITKTNVHGYVPLVVNTSRSFPHSWLVTGFVTRVIRRLTLVEQELLTLSEHMSSPPIFRGSRVPPSFVICVMLSVLRFTNSDYPFNIFKLFLISQIIFGKMFAFILVAHYIMLIICPYHKVRM